MSRLGSASTCVFELICFGSDSDFISGDSELLEAGRAALSPEFLSPLPPTFYATCFKHDIKLV